MSSCVNRGEHCHTGQLGHHLAAGKNHWAGWSLSAPSGSKSCSPGGASVLASGQRARESWLATTLAPTTLIWEYVQPGASAPQAQIQPEFRSGSRAWPDRRGAHAAGVQFSAARRKPRSPNFLAPEWDGECATKDWASRQIRHAGRVRSPFLLRSSSSLFPDRHFQTHFFEQGRETRVGVKVVELVLHRDERHLGAVLFVRPLQPFERMGHVSGLRVVGSDPKGVHILTPPQLLQ